MTDSAIIVIGIGNDLRRDDGVGLAVAAALAGEHIDGVEVRTSTGETTELIELWTGRALAVIVDAIVCTPPNPGRIHRLGPDELPGARGSTSSHAVDLAAVWQLGQALQRLPDRLIVIGVEGIDFAPGAGLTPLVAAAVDGAAIATAHEIREWQREHSS